MPWFDTSTGLHLPGPPRGEELVRRPWPSAGSACGSRSGRVRSRVRGPRRESASQLLAVARFVMDISDLLRQAAGHCSEASSPPTGGQNGVPRRVLESCGLAAYTASAARARPMNPAAVFPTIVAGHLGDASHGEARGRVANTAAGTSMAAPAISRNTPSASLV